MNKNQRNKTRQIETFLVGFFKQCALLALNWENSWLKHHWLANDDDEEEDDGILITLAKVSNDERGIVGHISNSRVQYRRGLLGTPLNWHFAHKAHFLTATKPKTVFIFLRMYVNFQLPFHSDKAQKPFSLVSCESCYHGARSPPRLVALLLW